MSIKPVVFQLPADFQARCAAKNRRIADGEAMTMQNLSDALGLPFEFVAAAVAITEVLMTGQPVLIPHRQQRRTEMAVKTRRAEMRINSFDPETRTFTAVAATETPVLRSSYSLGNYQEVLSLAPGAVRMGRLQSGRAPILDAHQSFSARDQLGVITGARIESRKLVIDGQLSMRQDVTPIADDMEAGIICNISAAYFTHSRTEQTGSDGSLTIVRTDWEPIEVSIVPIGADENSHIRSNTKGATMAVRPKQTSRRPAAVAVSAPAAHAAIDHQVDGDTIDDDDEDGEVITRAPAVQRAHAPMSQRHVAQARAAAVNFGLTEDFANRCIADGMNLAEVRAAAQDEAARAAPPRQNSHHSGMIRGGDAELDQSVSDALFGRMTGRAPEGRGRELMGRSILELGTMVLEARGERVSWRTRDELATRIMTRAPGFHTTSDFPNLLTAAGNRVLLEAYQAAATPLKAIARRRDAVDFRALSFIKLSEAPTLDKVPEGGEVKYGTRAEAKEGFRLNTFAKIFALSRQAIINDDLAAFADTSVAWGRSAAETEATEFVALLTANSGNGINLDDGNPLYTTGRGNKAGSGTIIDVTNLGAARKALREMKGLDGVTPISVTPKHLVVGAAKETQAEQVLASLSAAEVAEVNPFAGKLTLHVEPRLTGNAWRLFADPAELAVIAYAYLSGQEGPQMAVKEGWDVLGTEFRCVLDFGCGITEYRGTYLNAGA